MDESLPAGKCSSIQISSLQGCATTRLDVATPLELQQRCRALCTQEPIVRLLRALPEVCQPHLVGGMLRDLAQGITPDDFDLATKSTPQENQERCQALGLRTIDTGLKHGTISVLVGDACVEITTFRKPAATQPDDYSDNIVTDLAGRDFTINAIAFALHQHEIVDPYAGLSDLKAGLLRAVGDPQQRFNEDPLRMLRMLRFGPAAGRQVEAATLAAAQTLTPRIAHVSPERIRSELEQILVSPHVSAALRMMQQTGLLALVLPEALPSIGFEQNEYHIEDVFEHTLSVVQRCPAQLRLRLVGLFHDLGKPASFSVGEDGRRHFFKHEQISHDIAKSVMERLRFSTEEIRAVTSLVALHMRPFECGPQGVRRLLRDLGPLFEEWRSFKMADRTPTMDRTEFDRRVQEFDRLLAAELARVQGSVFSRLEVSGSDIMQLGIPQSPRVGQILAQLRERVLEQPELNQREKLLELAREMVGTGETQE
jgi:tRNA nucleotidyltransferase (CCA-adding enzyme)